MRASETRMGKRPTLPQALAVIMLYGQMPGLRRLGDGKLLVTFADLGRSIGATTSELKARLSLLKLWGIIRDVEIERSTAVVWLAKPLGFGAGDK